MTEITTLFAQPWADRLGWTLLHFLWQGTAIAVVLAAAQRAMSGPRARYLAACLALAGMVAAPMATYSWLGSGEVARVHATADIALPAVGAAEGVRAGAPMQGALPWLVMAWFAGMIVFSVRLAGGWLTAARLRSRGARPAPAEWQESFGRLVTRMGVSSPVKLLVSARVDAPAVLGWLRPVVLAPVGALTGLPSAHVEALLAHELAHILRHDYLVNLVQGVAEAVLFYHPAVWWVSKQIRTERELCCDDLAVAVSGDVLTYARALAELEVCRPPRMGAAMAAGGGSLAHRIARLVEPSRTVTHTMPGPGAAWALSVLLLLGIGTLAILGAQEPAGPGANPTVDRASIWVDTVKQGDLTIEVRGLGVTKSSTAVELKIAETQAKELQVGQVAAIDLRTSTIYAGILDRIHPEAVNGTITVDVRIPGALPPSATPGTQVDGTIRVGILRNVVYVGRPVVGRTNSQETLYKIEPDGKQAVPVSVFFGAASVNQIEIRSGLLPGEKVIVSDMSAYKTAVRVNLK